VIRTLGADHTFSNLSIYSVAQRVRSSHGTEVINILAIGREPVYRPQHELVSEVNAMLLDDVLMVITLAGVFLAVVYILTDIR
jgi:hypothetical protein